MRALTKKLKQDKMKLQQIKEFMKTSRFEKLVIVLMCMPFAIYMLILIVAAIIFHINHPGATWMEFLKK